MIKGKSLSAESVGTDTPTEPTTWLKATPEPSHTQRTSSYRLLVIVGVLAVFLAALFYAEISWLHTALPQDRASRVALAVFPRTDGVEPEGTEQRDWTESLVQHATSTKLLRELAATLGLRDSSTGEPLTSDELAASMRVSSQCIQQGQVRGILLSNVVRGSDPDEVDRIAREWSSLFTQRSATEFPHLVIQPVSSLGVPYEICQ